MAALSARAARSLLALIAVVVAVTLAGCGGSDGTPAAAPGDDVAGVAETKALLDGIPQKQLALGSPKAPVTLVEVIDLQCPFCEMHQREVQPKIVKDFVRTGRLRIVLVPVSFLGDDSTRMEIVMLRLSQQAKAWDFANLVFWNHGQEGSGYATDGWLRRIVEAIPGTDSTAASTTPDKDILQAAQASKLIAERGMAKAGGAGTPFFTIGKTGDPIYDLTPILAGAPPDAYDVIAKPIKRVETGKAPEPLEAAPEDSSAQEAGDA
ncbi:MAG: thioredoxin domain-containing protein [Solirubrobacteraceae bacterium]|nr:thioredoxin domain-containing protein [Solirubrobacteraceae bacterium]